MGGHDEREEADQGGADLRGEQGEDQRRGVERHRVGEDAAQPRLQREPEWEWADGLEGWAVADEEETEEEEQAMKQLLVFGEKTFKIEVPDDAKITFGPFSPPTRDGYARPERAVGTLRIYKGSKENVV